jgi:hypothetical protein
MEASAWLTVQGEGKEAAVEAPEHGSRRRPRGCGEGTRTRPKAKALAVWAEA